MRLAWTLTGRWAVAEELVQDAFLRTHRRWDTIGTYQRPGGWVRRTLLQLATSPARRGAAQLRARTRLTGRRQDQEPPADADPDLWRAVRRLARRQAQVLALYYVEDLPVTEVAEIIGVAEGTVRGMLHDGRSALAARLGEAGGGTDMTAEARARRAVRSLRRTPVGDPPPIDRVRRRKTRRRLTNVGITVALVGGAVAWSAAGGTESDTPVVVGPSDTEAPAAGDGRPTSFLAVREDGTVIVEIDGVATDIANHGDPSQPAEGDPSYVAAVAWQGAEEVAYYELCCEPAFGAILRHAVETGTEERIVEGYRPSVRAGRLVFSTYTGVAVVDLGTGQRRAIDTADGSASGSVAVDISPDGSLIAMEDITGPSAQTSILVVPADAASLDAGTTLEAPAGKSWRLPVFRADGNLLVAEQCCGTQPEGAAAAVVLDPATGEEVERSDYEAPVLDQHYDQSGAWLLYVTTDGVLRWRGEGETGTLGEGYRNADW